MAKNHSNEISVMKTLILHVGRDVSLNSQPGKLRSLTYCRRGIIKKRNADTEGNNTAAVTLETNVANEKAETRITQNEDERSETYVSKLSSEQPSTSHMISPE